MSEQAVSEQRGAEQIAGGVQQPQRHDSALKHVSGEASFIDDLPERADLLHVYLGISARAHAEITQLDLEPVRKASGVVLVLTADDVPGVNDVSPTHRSDEPVFATTVVEYAGQPLFAVAARSRTQARHASPRHGFAPRPRRAAGRRTRPPRSRTPARRCDASG